MEEMSQFEELVEAFLASYTITAGYNDGRTLQIGEDLESYKADLEEALEELNDMREDWKPEKEPNMDEEIELIKKWVKEREDFINE